MLTDIEGVELEILRQHFDDRGWFEEVLKETNTPFFNKFGQLSASMMYSTDVIKAWHLHYYQTDFWWVPFGTIKAVVWDLRPDSGTYDVLSEYYLGDDRQNTVLKISPGIAHGLKVLKAPSMLVYVTSHPYNPNDEIRYPHDYKSKYNWLEKPLIK